MSIRIKNERFIYIPILATALNIFAIISGYFTGKSFQDMFIYLIGAIIEIIAICVMRCYNMKKGLQLYLFGLYFGILYYIIFRADLYQNGLGFTTIIIFITVLTSLVFDEPMNYILALLNYSSLVFKYIYSSPYSNHLIAIELSLIAGLIFILLEAKRWINRLHRKNMDSLKETQKASLRILGKVSEIKDKDTDNHLKRVEIIVTQLVHYLKEKKEYKYYITDKYLEDISSAAYLHDIGKIGISDRILNKPGKLTDEEFSIVKKHTVFGHELLLEASDKIQSESIFTLALEIARHHHEKWDGTGYPDKLSGKEIPLSARILAIIDVYDALITKRSYKEPLSHEEALVIIRKSCGTHFDPGIGDVFLKNSSEIYGLIKEYL